MKENDKIYVAKYLKDLNDLVENYRAYKGLKKDQVETLTCKELAKRCNVTPATITNLNTSSKYSLIYKIADEILESYYGFFWLDESIAKKENPDELIYPRDRNYIIMNLTCYYTEKMDKYIKHKEKKKKYVYGLSIQGNTTH